MKIIELGPTTDEDFELECYCEKYGNYDTEGCSTKVLITELDIYKYMVSSGGDDSPDIYGYQYICPVCGKGVRIKENLIPIKNKTHINYRYSVVGYMKESDLLRERTSRTIREKWIRDRTERLKVKTLKLKEVCGG